MMDLTPPGAPDEGHIYLNDPTGETITVYKDSKTAVSKKPNGETVAFAALEGLINYLQKSVPLTSANSLSIIETELIDDVAKSYGFIGKVDYIGKPGGSAYVTLSDKYGEKRFTIRKLNGTFHFYELVYSPKTGKGEPEAVVAMTDWHTMVKALQKKLALFNVPKSQDKNALSLQEMEAVGNLAKKYMLGTKQSVIVPNQVPYLSIQSNMGSNVFAVRKLESMYEILNIISDKNWEKLEIEAYFPDVMTKLEELFKKYFSTAQAPEKMGEFEFSPQESSDISKLASQFGLLIKGTTMTLEPDKHQVAGIEIIKPDGKVVYHLHKDNGTYRIYKVFDGPTKTWDLWYDTKNAAAFFQQLTLYLNGHTPGEPQPAAGGTTPLSDGITPTEYAQIKTVVDGYGDTYWTEWIEKSAGIDIPYVAVYIKNYEGKGILFFTATAKDGHYQLNDSSNLPVENIPTFQGLIARIHDRLADQGGPIGLSPHDLDKINDITHKMGFDSDVPEGDEPYTYVNNDEVIEVYPTGTVTYNHPGVFGPIKYKNPKVFISWFVKAYAKGKVPKTGNEFAQGLFSMLDNAGFISKDTGAVPVHVKINAIKAVRFHIMDVTGGPCSLAKTKWAVENFGAFIDHIKANGLPNMDKDAVELAVQLSGSTPSVNADDKLTDEEQTVIGAIAIEHAPSITYQHALDNAIVIWIGNNLTSYKVVKEHDVYRVYTDKDSEWVIQNQVSTFNELKEYLQDMLAHIAKALANSKLEQPPAMTEPSSLFPENMLSPSEVVEVKKLVKKFKLPISTTYSKKLTEAAGGNKENNAYNLVIADDPHKVYIKISKAEGKYIISKGLVDAYFPLKKFDAFHNMLAYLDYFLNSYIKAPESVAIEKISDNEVKLLRDLVKKYKVKGKVRRKYMTAQGQGKVPYVSIELDDVGMKDYAISKTAKGVYKLFETKVFIEEEWKNVAVTDTWEGMYDIIGKILNDEPLPGDIEKYNPPVLNADQFEWLETLMKTQKPGVELKKWGNGSIGGYDPTNVINGVQNPLFVIRFDPSGNGKRILQVQTEDGGMGSDEYPFNTFEAMAHFIAKNIEIVTQLLKGEVSAEGKLASVMDKAGFEYIDHKEIGQDAGGVKLGTVYENSANERLYLYDDGSSRLWYKHHASGETYKKEFTNIAELVSWFESQWDKGSNELKEMKEHLAYLGFATDSKSDKWTTVWTKTFGPDHQPSQDIVELHTDGGSKVIPAPLTGDTTNQSSPFFFNTWTALKQYLGNKYIKGKNWSNAYFKQIMKDGKFKKNKDDNAEMGYVYQSDKLLVVPFPSGGIMRTLFLVEPKLMFSFESTYDLARRIELFLDSTPANNPVGWSTGHSELDKLIGDAGFKFQGEEDASDHGPKLVFLDAGGIKLTYYMGDEGSTITFTNGQGIGFTDFKDLMTHLKTYAEKPPATKNMNTPAADAAAEGSVMKYDEDAQSLITQDLAGLAPSPKMESVHFQYNSNAMGTGEIRVVTKNILQFAIGRKYEGADLLWYVRQKVADSPAGLYMTYRFKLKSGMVSWIKAHISNLLSFKSISGGTSSVPPPKVQPPLSDFGSTYHQSPAMEALLHNAGFHQEMNSLGILWEHKSDLQMQIFENGFVWRTEKGMKEVSIGKPYHGDIIQKMCLKVTPDMSAVHVDQIITNSFKTREEELFEQAVDYAANEHGEDMSEKEINTKMEDKGFTWAIEEMCWVNDDLMQVVVASPSLHVNYRFWWIQGKQIKSDSAANETELLQWVGPGGKIEHQKAESTDKETGGQFVPSGETYKTHEVEGNADMIWLNEHDGALLQSLGFIPVPSENNYYKNPKGNIVKFFDTGKAEYIDYFGHPDKPEEGEVVEFNNIPHSLKFMVAKHNGFPFSVQNYKDDDGENVYEIQLNPHDDAIMEELGFQWSSSDKKYTKIIDTDNPPKVQEAKKKKKEDPNQMGLPFGGPLPKMSTPPLEPDDFANAEEPDDYYEIFTAYDTGNAIWQSVKGDGPKEQIMNEKEGKIPDILQFVWKRWQHQLVLNLLGKDSKVYIDTQQSFIPLKKPITVDPSTKPVISQAFLNIKGLQAPPNIHEKFEKRGFDYEMSLKGYYKKYKEFIPGMMWALVKWDGNTYFISYPHTDDGKTFIHKEFTSVDPYYVMNTLLKIENADFMNLVQSEEDALKKKDAKYFNAPNEWLPYSPFSPKKHPGNIKPEDWIDKELGGYGFVWSSNFNMYYWKDLNGKIGTHWQSVRFDKNGTIVYFYHDKKGDPRYFCSKDFSEVQHKIEVHHVTADLFKSGGTSAGTVPPKTYPLDAKNYPTAPDWDKNFSQTGNAITLKPSDHKAVLEVGFKFSVADGTYSNPKTKDQFKIFSNGFAWYKLTGTGEGMDNNLEHFFDMLKSKYGQLEWGFHPLTGYEVVQIQDKFDKLGFKAVEHPEAADDLYFERYPTDGKSSINVKEVVVVFPNHTMNFYLYDATSKDRLLGVSEFESLSYGIHALEDFKHLIKLHLAHDLEPEMTSHGFAYVPDKLRYEHVLGNGGLKIYINFFGNGQAKAQLMEPDSSTSDGFEEVKEKVFLSFYDAILWAAHKNFEIQPQPPTPVDTKEVKKVMKDLGFKDNGVTLGGTLSFSTSMGKSIFVSPKDGKVDYRFQYVANNTTGELQWGQSVFYNWAVFMDFLKGTTQVSPKSGKLPFTPHPATKALPKIPQGVGTVFGMGTFGKGTVPPMGTTIKGKIQGKLPMPFSGFDYEGWAAETDHNPNATIKLVPDDDLMLQKLDWAALQSEDDAYYYTNSKTGDKVYFFVNGHAKIIPKNKPPITLPKVKMALEMIWAQYYEDKQTPDAGINDPANWGVKPAASGGLDVAKELHELGFSTIVSSGNALTFEKKTSELRHSVVWDKKENTLDYEATKTSDPGIITASFKEDVNEGLAMLKNIFIPKPDKQTLDEQEYVVEKMKEMGFKTMGGVPAKGTQYTTIVFHRITPKFVYDVIYHVKEKTIEFIQSTTKMQKGYHKIVKQWTHDIAAAMMMLENLFAFGSMGIVLPKKTKEKVLAGTEDMPWSGIDYKQLWKGKGYKGMILGFVEEETMFKLGWKRDNMVEGHCYRHGNETIVFYPDEKVDYYSDYTKGQVTQKFTKVEDVLRWLWKNKASAQKKEEKPTQEQVEAVLIHLGFQKIPMSTVTLSGDTKKGYAWRLIDNDSSLGGVNDVTFDIDANTLRWTLVPKNKVLKSSTHDYDTIHKGLNSLISALKGTTPKAEEKMPYSGTDYADWWKTYWPDVPKNTAISLKPEDDETMAKMGFDKIKNSDENADPAYKFVYKRKDGPEMMYFFAGGQAAFWKDPEDGPYYYNTAKDGMQMLWDKYMK